MKVGIVSSAANYLPTWDERFAHLKALGYETVDHGLSDIHQPWYTDDTALQTHCAQVRAAAEKHGLEISQVHGPWPTDDTTAEGRAEGWRCMHRAVYACHLLGAKHLVIHPQMPFGWSGGEDEDAAEQATVDLLTELIPDCEKHGMIVCLENMPFKKQRISAMNYIVRAVEKVNSPYVGICLDTGHCHYLRDDIAENVRLAAPYLKVLHIHDNRQEADSHLLPLQGSLDWTAFARALAESGFDGSLSLETGSANAAKMSPAVIAAHETFVAAVVKQLRDMVEEAR